MTTLCTICARGGSKGVPLKNMRNLLGRPLIAHTIEQAKACSWVDRVVVSTDCREIARVAREAGAEVPFLRPPELATDESPKLPVIKHAVRYFIDILGYVPEYVIDFDPTSPLRMADDINRCIRMMQNDATCDLVITGYRSNKNPYFDMVEPDPEGYVHLAKRPEDRVVRRQDAPVVYAMNASVYLWKREALFRLEEVVSGRVRLVEMPEERSITIDSEVDFQLVELLLKQRGGAVLS